MTRQLQNIPGDGRSIAIFARGNRALAWYRKTKSRQHQGRRRNTGELRDRLDFQLLAIGNGIFKSIIQGANAQFRIVLAGLNL